MFIDDQPASIEAAKDEITGSIDDVSISMFNFEEGMEKLVVCEPDIIILDVWDGPPRSSNAEGKNVMTEIWDKRFCPVVVYSADPDIIREVSDYDHPLIEYVLKGSDSDLRVRCAVERMQGHVEIMRTAKFQNQQAISRAMRELAPHVFQASTDEQFRIKMMDRGVRRRVAATMDETSSLDEKIQPWEIYLNPPVSSDLRMGDVIMRRSAAHDQLGSFRVVLTPSCDIITDRNKVDHVLIAKCCSLSEVMSHSKVGRKKQSIRDSHMLTQGFINQFVPFPGLDGKIPTMAANLKDLELVPFEDIIGENAKFERVASIDSPFRELVSWAYLQIAGRIGLPERDTEIWIQEILEDIENDAGDTD